jgi:hypothetical protein
LRIVKSFFHHQPVLARTLLKLFSRTTKGGEAKMKNAKVFLAAMLLLGNIASSSVALADDAMVVIETETVASDNYCHQKFQAMDPNTLGSDNPTLKSADSADVIDFYGSCDETATGKDQAWQQKLDWLFLQNAQ